MLQKSIKVWDCFPFFNELDLLELRLNELNDRIYRFVLVESLLTHQGKQKPLYYAENKHRFDKFNHKIIHVVDDGLNAVATKEYYKRDENWAREAQQRNKIIQGLEKAQCADDDIVMVCDLDEIVSSKKLPIITARTTARKKYLYLDMPLFNRWFNYKSNMFWKMSFSAPYYWLKEHQDLSKVRVTTWVGETQKDHLEDAGWHFSFIGNEKAIQQKLEAFAHSEYNNNKFKTSIDEKLSQGRDLLDRKYFYVTVPIDDSFPKFIKDNIIKYKEMGFIKV